ncbi:MAG: hypothetical protein WB681_12085 [Candidatus Cybelea sp.]
MRALVKAAETDLRQVDARAGSLAREIGAKPDERLDLPPLSCCGRSEHLARHNGIARVPDDWETAVPQSIPPLGTAVEPHERFARRRKRLHDLHVIAVEFERIVKTMERNHCGGKCVRRLPTASGGWEIIIGPGWPGFGELESVCRICERFRSDCIRIAQHIDSGQPGTDRDGTARIVAYISDDAVDQQQTARESVTA